MIKKHWFCYGIIQRLFILFLWLQEFISSSCVEHLDFLNQIDAFPNVKTFQEKVHYCFLTAKNSSEASNILLVGKDSERS